MKLTKNELRTQQIKLTQLERYLPTLQLKKALLQTEVMHASIALDKLAKEEARQWEACTQFGALLGEREADQVVASAAVTGVDKGSESIAGVEVPTYGGTHFAKADYGLFETPLWFDSAGEALRQLRSLREEKEVARGRKEALEAELREVSIRVNLFEKIMIPRTVANIKKIKVFLGDQQLAAVAQAKMAKAKVLAKKGGAR